MTSFSLDSVLIGLEATSVYGDNLVYFLREDAALARFNSKIHVLNLKQVSKFKEAYNDLPKNDFIDSFVIADCLRFGRINKEVYMEDYRYKALQSLTRARYYAVTNLTREKQRFINVLFKKYSTMTQKKVFSDTFSTTALAVYEEFEFAEALEKMDLQELTAFIIEKGKNRFPDPDAVAKTIQKAALAKYAGLAWQQHQSGNFEAQTTRMIHSSNRFLKYYLCEAAFSLVRCDKEYRDFYNLKYKEVNRFQHKRALALTARKFVRLVFALFKDKRLYRSAE